MGFNLKFRNQSKTDIKYLSKNKSIKIYKQKRSRIELFKQEVNALQKKYEEIDSQAIQTFDDFPLSRKTRKGLKEADYITPTEIQKDSIGLALKGHDILGAAKTGSGKTLAFVIPMLEHLYCSGWSILDGLAAIVITPTRELAYQIFAVLNKVGANHSLSAALLIGGTDLREERKLLDKCCILICTPGRLLQHMDENPLFDASNMKLLILDEADRILDLGFEKSVNAILENLPKERQTLLFSATQTKSVKDLARLSLKNPVYVSVHEHAKYSTPETLRQNYLVCEAHSKMNLIWSFIKNHKQQKTLVFMATCKQVKYTFESICRLRPGVSIMSLYGSLNQYRRLKIYKEFCSMNHVVMFATDVAARGLDFPDVSWVVQLDCPEDVNTYIHRAGRTARYQKNGESLLVLLPSEKESMAEQLKNRKIPIEEIKVNPQKFQNIQRKLDAICARDVNLKNSAQRAFKSYLKNILLMKDKTVFDVTKIDSELYAKSLGLAMAPRIRFLEKQLKTQLESKFSSENDGKEESDSDDDLLKLKGEPILPPIEEDDLEEFNKSKRPLTKAAVAKRILKKNIKANTVIKFDEEGVPIREICGTSVPVVAADLQNQMLEEGYSIEKAKQLKEKEDEVDKMIYRQRIKQKHREERRKLKEDKKKKDQASTPQLQEPDVSANFTQLQEPNESENRDSGSEVDDPNNLMNSLSSEEEEEEEDEQNNPSDSEGSNLDTDKEVQISRKRKIESSPENVKRQNTDTGRKTSSKFVRTLDDDEQLALHFLANS